MGIGIYKKLKDGFKKGIRWLRDIVPKVLPVLKEEIKNEKVKNLFNEYSDIASNGIEAFDEAVNNHNYNKAIDWTKANLTPRLKQKSSNWN